VRTAQFPLKTSWHALCLTSQQGMLDVVPEKHLMTIQSIVLRFSFKMYVMLKNLGSGKETYKDDFRIVCSCFN